MTIGYQGIDGIEMEEDVIVCPTCGYKHVDERTGDTSILGERVRPEIDKLAYFRCYHCRGVLFTVSTDHHHYPTPVPKDVQQRLIVRKIWDLVKLEEEERGEE
jgi:hypothetical protein